MTAEALIQHFGYLAVLIGTFLEGETILVLGGLVAHRGYLSLPLVIMAAFIGTLLGDQLYFYLGRRHAEFLLRRRSAWREKIARVDRLLARYQTLMILSFRFLYGIRTVTPFAIGMSAVSARKYISLNVLGAAIWAIAVGSGGYYFGRTIETIIGDIKRYEAVVFAFVGVMGVVIWMIHFRRQKKKHRS